jgi:glycosyltransferase involved in cell wall biosynthesis
LHFLNDGEERDLGNLLTHRVRLETKIVRLLARRADVIVAPSSSMAERIASVAPYLSSRVIVRHHPVSVDETIRSGRERVGNGQRLLCPVLHAPFKRLERVLPLVAEAVAAMRLDPAWSDLELRCTLTVEEMRLSGVGPGNGLVALGRLSSAQVAQEWGTSTAILYPTFIESFGYPLAEANVHRIPILAMGNESVREIAGDALVPLEPTSPSTVRMSVEHAMTVQLDDCNVTDFDRKAYFKDLFSS